MKSEPRWQQLLLEAEPAELRGEGETAIARLVRESGEVRSAAQAILARTAAMHAALSGAAPGTTYPPRHAEGWASRTVVSVPPDGTWPAAIATATGLTPATSAPMASWHAPRSLRVRRALIGGGTLAATVLALLFSGRGGWRKQEPGGARLHSVTAALEAESDRPFAVFATSNPDIAVVWLFSKEAP
jgi:hypothetical protein